MSTTFIIYMSVIIIEIVGDNTLRIWDISAPPHAQQTIRAHDGEVLTCDWAKYDVVRVWIDVLNELQTHIYCIVNGNC